MNSTVVSLGSGFLFNVQRSSSLYSIVKTWFRFILRRVRLAGSFLTNSVRFSFVWLTSTVDKVVWVRERVERGLSARERWARSAERTG